MPFGLTSVHNRVHVYIVKYHFTYKIYYYRHTYTNERQSEMARIKRINDLNNDQNENFNGYVELMHARSSFMFLMAIIFQILPIMFMNLRLFFLSIPNWIIDHSSWVAIVCLQFIAIFTTRKCRFACTTSIWTYHKYKCMIQITLW